MLIGTHHGTFHADDVFAVAMLKQIYPNADIVRSRDPEILRRCDIVVDVGHGKYDHHTNEKVYRENGLPYASAGLIWRDFGAQVLATQEAGDASDILIKAIDERLIQGIDAIDNGVEIEKDAKLKTVSELIGGFNPTWHSHADEHAAFAAAVAFATQILTNQIKSEIARLAAVELVASAYEHRLYKEFLILETFCPWSESLFNMDLAKEVLYVIFPDKSGQYRIQVVPKQLGSFEARKPLPEQWAGKEGDELGSLIGIPDAVFCHPARFIAGAKSKDSILIMAQLALQN
ncbi:MYG1 family protein [Alicyclobacillus fodiniaquatilis]|jgi:uncharacterized UPF0160 family protein|uniref:MYG1 family protein n=1 Tax=Alicyclobacillus fodiniaquatilis TaxID=1661150 RepID=A0ABW4JFJ5_9BACL